MQFLMDIDILEIWCHLNKYVSWWRSKYILGDVLCNTDNKVNKTDIALLLLDVLVVIFLNFETQNICINQNWTAHVPLLNISSTKVMDWMDWTNRMGKKTSVYMWYIFILKSLEDKWIKILRTYHQDISFYFFEWE